MPSIVKFSDLLKEREEVAAEEKEKEGETYQPKEGYHHFLRLPATKIDGTTTD